jgi:uncharacterized membrane protein YeaQ/YmgE (transglycosylase-associated protein family)
MKVETFLQLLVWAITGSIAGYVASLLLRAHRQGCLINMILGVVGAFVGGFVINTLIPGGITGWGFLDGIINAIVGAVIVLIALELILPGRQLGVREEGEGRKGKHKGINPLDFFR